MTTATHDPARDQSAAAIREALARRGQTSTDFARELKISTAALSNWITGKAIPSLSIRPRVAQALGIDPDLLQPTGNLREQAKQAKRPAAKKGRPRTMAKTRAGPAAKAVALLAARNGAKVPHAQSVSPSHARHTQTTDTFGFAARSDGTMHVRLDMILDFEKGAGLMKYLLDFGLVPAPTETTQPDHEGTKP